MEFLHDFPGGEKTERLSVQEFSNGDLIIALVDTHKEAYSPSHPAVLPNGDLIVAQAVAEAVQFASEADRALDIALRANEIVRAKLEAENKYLQYQINLDNAARVPGAVAVIAKINMETGDLEIFQSCDAGAIYCGNRNRNITDYGWQITPYRNWETELFHQRTIQDLLEQVSGDKRKMWNKFYWSLSGSRESVNNKSSKVVIINGTDDFKRFADNQIVKGEALHGAMFFTDGALFDPWAFPAERYRLLAQWLKNPDIASFLEWNREMQKTLVGKTHVYGGIPEASLAKLTLRR